MNRIMIQETHLTLLTDKLNIGEHFKFLKFGDGEFSCYKGKTLKTEEFENTLEITTDYRQILNNLNPKHFNALQPLVMTLPDLAEIVPKFNWYDADVLHNASINGELYPLFESLQDKPVVLICNRCMAEMKKYFNGCNYQIIISDSYCYKDKGYVMDLIADMPQGMIYLISASVMSEPVIYHSREDSTFIDIGSVFEPYLKRSTRWYHNRLSEETIRKNLGIYAESYGN